MTTSNIIPTNFKQLDTNTQVLSARVRQNQSGSIEISRMSVIQLIYGAKIAIEANQSKMLPKHILTLYMELNELFLESAQTSDIVTLTVTRKQMIELKGWVETRLTHCEEERKNNTMGIGDVPKFNPDTYIHLKMLLLDIREWLCGDILDVIHVEE